MEAGAPLVLPLRKSVFSRRRRAAEPRLAREYLRELQLNATGTMSVTALKTFVLSVTLSVVVGAPIGPLAEVAPEPDLHESQHVAVVHSVDLMAAAWATICAAVPVDSNRTPVITHRTGWWRSRNSTCSACRPKARSNDADARAAARASASG